MFLTTKVMCYPKQLYSGSHGVPIKFCVLLQTSLSKTQTLPLKKIYNYIISRNIDCFAVDLLHLHVHLTFVTLCVLSVIREQ